MTKGRGKPKGPSGPKGASKTAGVEEQMRLLMRGVEYGDDQIRAAMESELRERLKEGRPLRVYCGYDPTSTELTLGNAVSMRKLRQFQDLGHEVTFLIGNFTGLVGDPSDKDSARPMLTIEQAEANSRTWLRQAYRVLDGEKTIVRHNADWLGKLTMADVVQLASRFTVAQFLERDIYVQRRQRGEAIYLHEFLYALLQAYDAVAMETDVQVGGTDQIFNILAGRTLQRALGQQPQIAVCLPMLVGTDGKSKMSKSLGNHIGLDDSPDDMYGKVMSIPDDVMMDYFTLVTDVPEAELSEMREQLAARSVNPMELKKRLAREIVTQYHGAEAADREAEQFLKVFGEGEAPEQLFKEQGLQAQITKLFEQPAGSVDIRHISDGVKEFRIPLSSRVGFDVPPRYLKLRGPGWNLANILLDAGLVSSASEAQRLIAQGAIDLDGTKVTSVFLPEHQMRDGAVLRVGKHRFLRIVDADKKQT